MNKNGVVIGLDVGERRVGVARGDHEVCIATPLTPLVNDATVFTEISQLAKETGAETIVIGLPRDAEGRETAQSAVSRDFAVKLSKAVPTQIVFQDESLTSMVAEQNLRSRKGFQEQMLRDGTLDCEAAAIILTDYLEGNRNGA